MFRYRVTILGLSLDNDSNTGSEKCLMRVGDAPTRMYTFGRPARTPLRPVQFVTFSINMFLSYAGASNLSRRTGISNEPKRRADHKFEGTSKLRYRRTPRKKSNIRSEL